MLSNEIKDLSCVFSSRYGVNREKHPPERIVSAFFTLRILRNSPLQTSLLHEEFLYHEIC